MLLYFADYSAIIGEFPNNQNFNLLETVLFKFDPNHKHVLWLTEDLNNKELSLIATHSNLLIPISLQSDVVNILNFKL